MDGASEPTAVSSPPADLCGRCLAPPLLVGRDEAVVIRDRTTHGTGQPEAVRAGRIRIDREPRHWIRQALAADRVEPVPLMAETAISAALLPSGFARDPADRIIYATAVDLGVPLLTKDRRIHDFDRQRTIW